MRFVAIPILLVVGWFTPWWMLVLAGVGTGFYSLKIRQAISAGFLLGALVWGLIIVVLEIKSDGLVSHRLGGLFGVNNKYVFTLVIIIVAGTIGFISSLLGHWMRTLVLVSKRD